MSSRQKFIVVNGHIHNYERFEFNEITHIITGGGGAAPYPVLIRGPQDQYHDPGFPVFNYVVLTIHGKQLEGTMYKIADPNRERVQRGRERPLRRDGALRSTLPVNSIPASSRVRGFQLA